jgi:two-component system, OmpR family, sensor histidine kinase SenX3
MDGGAFLVIAAIVAAGVGGTALARRSLAAHAAEAERRADAATEELHRREAQAREQRAVQDLILGSMQEGVLLLNAHLDTAFANEALARHLGGRPSSAAQLFPVDLREAVHRVAETSETMNLEVELTSPARWLGVTLSPAGDGAVLVVITDVTEARRVEAVRRDFVANASHELKTPAASIQAAAETLRAVADDDPAAVPRFAVQLEQEARRLSRIVADLLDLSRLESGSELGEDVRLDALVREEVERCDEVAREAGVRLRVEASQPATVAGSPRDLSLLVRNLVNNAIRYTRPGGAIDVGITETDAQVVMTVSDTGVGIPRRDLPRVFERFYRVDRARSRDTGGTGLGLAIVRHVAENHGGSVAVTSELGMGSTFTVQLPAAPNREHRRSTSG